MAYETWSFLSIKIPNQPEIQIQNYRKNYSWKQEWTNSVLDELKKEQYKNGETAMLNIEIDEEDLDELECDGYNSATQDEKREFWVVGPSSSK